jgi:hypothetical protein
MKTLSVVNENLYLLNYFPIETILFSWQARFIWLYCGERCFGRILYKIQRSHQQCTYIDSLFFLSSYKLNDIFNPGEFLTRIIIFLRKSVHWSEYSSLSIQDVYIYNSS